MTCRLAVVTHWAYIVEAADDIAYCLADIEDAVEKGVISRSELIRALTSTFAELEPEQRPVNWEKTFAQCVEYAEYQASKSQINPNSEFFVWIRVQLVHPLVKHAAEQFIEHIEPCYHGHFNRALLEDNSQFHAITRCFKQVARQHVFSHSEVEALELQGYAILSGLLDIYRPLLQANREEFDRLLSGNSKAAYPQRLANKLPERHVARYRLSTQNASDSEAFYHRCRLLQDTISGMTDQFAQDEYRLLMGLNN